MPKQYGTFPQFPRFPADIRWLVWEQELSHERLIDIELQPVKHAECEEKTKHPSDYEIILDSRWRLSNLFQTTSESRRVALAFYRVQLPCWYRQRHKGELFKTSLYICPELDTLMLDGFEVFENFAHDLWACDPRRVGLINLALNITSPVVYYKTPSTQGRDISVLKEALSRITRLTLLTRRGCPKPWGGNIKIIQRNHIVPIAGGVLGFDRLPCDYRLNDQDLKEVFTHNKDVRELFYRWFRFLVLLGVQHSHKVDYRFGICRHGYETSYIRDQNAALEWVQRHTESLKRWVLMSTSPTHTDPMDDVLKHSPQPVVGFWLFPMESLGPLPDINEIHSPSSDFFTERRVLDMSKYKPELCLGNIYVKTTEDPRR